MRSPDPGSQPSPRAYARAGRWIVRALAVAGSILALFWFRDYVWEDSYITYRYAQNLASGNGFAFNPGERVFGTTTPFYALVLALGGALGADIPTVSSWLFAASVAGIAWLGARRLELAGSPAAGAVFALLVVSGLGNAFHFWGMETPLYTLLLLAALELAIAARPGWAGALLGCAVLTRYDAVLFAAPLLGVAWLRERRLPAKLLGALAAVVTPWLLYALVAFGSVLPNTLGAKAGDEGFVGYLVSAFWLQVDGIAPLRALGDSRGAGIVALLLLAPLPFALRGMVRREPLLTVLAAYPPLLWLGYGVIAPPSTHRWHLVPAAYAVVLLGLLAWSALLRPRLGSTLQRMVVALVVGIFPIAMLGVAREQQRLTATGFYHGRPHAYRQMAEAIRGAGLAGETVLTREPGYLAFLSGNPVIDAGGLVTTEVYFHGPGSRQTDFAGLLAERRPPLVITNPGFPPGGELQGYLPLHEAFPGRVLFVERSVLAARPRLLEASRGEVRATPEGVVLCHPFELGFADAGSRWRAAGGWISSESRIREAPGEASVLVTGSADWPWEGAESPPLWIDFDELAFRFMGTDARSTVAQLVVDGHVVLQLGGVGVLRHQALPEVFWPVAPWRGRTARLRFVDVGGVAHLVSGPIASRRYARLTPIDDFETGDYGSFWESGFGERPQSTSLLGLRLGPGRALGAGVALSLGQAGRPALVSRPFTIEHDAMTFVVYDLGGPQNRVELRVGGRVRRSFSGSHSHRPHSLRWGLRQVQGKTAQLRVVDEDGDSETGIGLDALAFVDD